MNAPLRVSQLMLSKGLGGAERYFVDLCLALAQRGHAVQALFHRDFVARAELAAEPRIECVPVRILGAWDRLAQRTLRKQVENFSPQVMQAHLARGALIGGAISSALAIPLVVKTHNLVKLKYYRRVDHFIATTAAQKSFLAENGIAPQRISVVPNFSALATVEDVAAAHRPLRFCSYGRMVGKKGFDILLRAFRRFLDSGQRGVLQIGGAGGLHDALRALTRDLDLEAYVEFVGWVAQPARLLDANDVFVLPSLDEPFGIVLLEAMARGKAIIATRTAGPLEVFDESDAWLVETGDSAALGHAMIAAAAQPEVLRQKACAALSRFQRHYSAAAVIPQILEVYAALLTQKRERADGSA